MTRAAFAGVAAMLVFAGSSVAAANPPKFSLRVGETRYLLPSEAHAGDSIRCGTAPGKAFVSTLPARPAKGVTEGTMTWAAGGRSMSINVRPNGAMEIRCGADASGTGSFGVVGNSATYVIGNNGLGLIRGRNSLAALERLYGAPSARSGASAAHCRVAWQSVGLVVTFAGGRCTAASTLTGAVVEGSRWRSLTGAQVGESAAKMLWDDQSAKLISPGRWLLASGGVSHHAKLVAITSGVGSVVRFELTGS
jgi:hypothetical protein